MIDFLCTLADGSVSHKIIRATTACKAAETYCAWYNANGVEYPNDRDIKVVHPNGKIEIFNVELIPIPDYKAKVKRDVVPQTT